MGLRRAVGGRGIIPPGPFAVGRNRPALGGVVSVQPESVLRCQNIIMYRKSETETVQGVIGKTELRCGLGCGGRELWPWGGEAPPPPPEADTGWVMLGGSSGPQGPES